MYSFKTFLNVLQFIWEGSLAVGSQRIPQSHTEQQSTHKRYIGREITEVAVSGEKQQGTDQKAGFI